MNRMNVPHWRERTDRNVDLESGAPAHRFTPPARPIDLLDEDVVVQRPTPTAQSIEVLETLGELGRYVPTSQWVAPVEEPDAFLPLVGAVNRVWGSGAGNQLYDPARDELFIDAGFGDVVGQRFGRQYLELDAADDMSVEAIAVAEHAEDQADVFIPLPHGEVFALPFNEGAGAVGIQDGEFTFGGGDDLLWLLPTPYDYERDTGLGGPGLGSDPWG